MKQQEPNSPIIAREFLPEKIHTRALLQTLGEFASRNARFQRGAIDQFGITLSEVLSFPVPDSVAHGWAEGDDTADPEDETTYGDLMNDFVITYDFLAERVNLGAGRFGHHYEFSMTAEQENMQAPPHIAALEYPDLEPQDAVGPLGPVTFRRKLLFNIASECPTLNACDSYTYVDWAGDDINAVCSCTDGQLHDEDEVPAFEIIGGESYDEESDGDMAMQLLPSQEATRLEHEAITVTDADQALGLWVASSSLKPIDAMLREKAYDDNLLLAFGTLGAMKRALKELAG